MIMYYKKIENDKLISVVEVDYLITIPEYKKITKEEYLELKNSLESGTLFLSGEDNSPTYSELSEACSILMGGATQ